MTIRQPPGRPTAGPPDHPSARPTFLSFHVQPRAKRTEVVGWHGDAIRIRLTAPPVDGAANTALIQFLADTLRVPRHNVTLVAGTTARRKRVSVLGRSLEEALQALGVD
jgi:uncharacterized protein (TIGR00251 family)